MMAKDLSSALPPDHPMYSDAIEAMKRYHQAQAEGITGAEIEGLRLLAEHQFQTLTDYQLRVLGGPAISDKLNAIPFVSARCDAVASASRAYADSTRGAGTR